MPKHRSRFRRAALVSLGLTALGLAGFHLRYPLPYVYRVLVHRDSDFEDIHRFPARSIAPAPSASELPVEIDSGVSEVLEQHPQVDDLETFLQETKTTAFLVVGNGRLQTEHYLNGHDRNSLQNTFSISKAVASAVVGLAVRDGLVDLGQSITEFLPELEKRDTRFAAITVEDLLDMRSGIRYRSGVGFPFVNADDALIYYHPDLESIVLRRTAVTSPPGSFQYNNYNPPLLGVVLTRATGMPVAEYLERELWGPLGAAQAAGWTIDDRGLERMESGFHARARDLARFGLLYLNGGLAGDKRILPESWVRETTRLSKGLEVEKYDGRHWGYRAGWWIVPRPDGPADFCAIGRYGQFIYVSPRYDAVFVRSGPGRGGWGDRDWTELFYFSAERLGAEASPI